MNQHNANQLVLNDNADKAGVAFGFDPFLDYENLLGTVQSYTLDEDVLFSPLLDETRLDASLDGQGLLDCEFRSSAQTFLLTREGDVDIQEDYPVESPGSHVPIDTRIHPAACKSTVAQLVSLQCSGPHSDCLNSCQNYPIHDINAFPQRAPVQHGSPPYRTSPLQISMLDSSTRTDHQPDGFVAGDNPMSLTHVLPGKSPAKGRGKQRPTFEFTIPEVASQRRATTTRRQDKGGMGRKKRLNRISDDARGLLEACFVRDPYPSPSRRSQLTIETKLEGRMVTNWFSNRRSRHSSMFCASCRQKGMKCSGQRPRCKNCTRLGEPCVYGDRSAPSRHMEQTEATSNSLTKDHLEAHDCEELDKGYDPVGRFLHTPLDEDPAALIAIKFSAATYHCSSGSKLPRTNSRVSSAESLSSASSAGSVSSGQSYGSRRGRRRFQQPDESSGLFTKPYRLVDNSSGRLYFCTFCGERFDRRDSWRRHEESKHVTRTTWTCSPHPTAWKIQRQCLYCPVLYPSADHIQGHRQKECLDRPQEERIFYRKDHLKQHIRNAHHSGHHYADVGPSFERWKGDTEPLPKDSFALRCGFCGLQCACWEERVAHIAQHYRDGYDLSDWWLRRIDYGGSAEAASKVEAAVEQAAVEQATSEFCTFRLSPGTQEKHSDTAVAQTSVQASVATGFLETTCPGRTPFSSGALIEGSNRPVRGRSKSKILENDVLTDQAATPAIAVEASCGQTLQFPHSCQSCGTTFPNLATAITQHPKCQYWSCSRLRGLRFAYENKKCIYCYDDLSYSSDEDRLLHLVLKHGYRACGQAAFPSFAGFQEHLVIHHNGADAWLYEPWDDRKGLHVTRVFGGSRVSTFRSML